MYNSIGLLLLLSVAKHTFANTDNWNFKTMECRRGTQTTCQSRNAPSSNCLVLLADRLTEEEKVRTLRYHNTIRLRVARGNETRGRPGPQPPATNMAALEWDDELAEMAQRWASQCKSGNDRERHVARFKVGQNIARHGTKLNISTIEVEDLIFSWYNEVINFNKNRVHKFLSAYSGNAARIGQYTQLVWAKTTKVGCGAAKYKLGMYYYFNFICNYGPSGNIMHEPMYLTEVRSPFEYISQFNLTP